MKIKFRGMTEDGKNIFSNSIQFDVDSNGREFCRLKDKFGNWLFVDPNSIAQFVGYDMNGDEVYEGDMVKDDYGESFTADTVIGLENENCFKADYDTGSTIFSYMKLKSAEKKKEHRDDVLGDVIFGYRKEKPAFKLKERGENENLS